MSHVCTGCGLDLAPVRAPPDPRYGLRVVVCPRCRRPCVRTRAGVERAWHRARRAAFSWLALLVQALVLACLVLAVSTPYLQIEDLVLGDWNMTWPELARALVGGSLADAAGDPDALRELAAWAGVFVGASVAAGAWLRFGLGHWKRIAAHAAWAGALALALLLPPTVEHLHEAVIERGRGVVGVEPEERLARLGAGVCSAVLAAGGIPLGRFVDRAWRARRRAVLAKRRRTIRELRRPTA